MSETEQRWPSRVPLIVLALVVSTLTIFPVPFIVSVPATVCLLLALARTRGGGREPHRAEVIAAAAVLLPISIASLVLPSVLPEHAWLAAGLGLVTMATAVAAALVPRVFVVHLVVVGALHVLYVRTFSPAIDVAVFMRDSTAALLEGRNPYTLTFLNPHDAAETAKFYAPELIDGDRIMIGFPYLPGALLGYVPGHLLGDVRYASIAATLVATFLAWRLTSDRIGRLLVATMPATPLALLTTTNYWVEPLLVLAVAVLGWAMVRGSGRWAAFAVALLLTVKQYAIVWVPLERLVRRRFGLPTLAAGVGVAAVLVIGAFALAPAGFWLSVVEVQFVQPFRDDSVSLAVDLVNLGLPVPPVVLSVGSLAAGLAAACWVRFTAPTTATWTVLGIGLSLLATVLMSKQAFVNYYFLVNACVVIGVALWPDELGRPARDG